MRKLFAALVIAVGHSATLSPGIAGAEEGADEAGCFERRQYDACFREGKHRFGEEDYTGARDAYLEGWKLQRNYEVAGNLGNVQLRLGDFAAAYVHLKYSLERLPPSQRGGGIEQKLRSKLQEALGRIGARRITVEPATATVSIDGEILELDAELWLALAPGEHVLLVESPGFEPKRQILDVRAGSEQVLQLDLARSASGDGRPAPKNPPVSDHDGNLSATQLGLGITGVALGVGGVVAGVSLAALSASRADDVDQLGAQIDAQSGGQHGCGAGSPLASSSTCADLAEASSDKATFFGAAIGAGVAGGLLLVGSVLYLTLPTESEDDEVAITLHPSPSGMTIRGTF